MDNKKIARELLKIASRVVESLVYDYDDLKKDKKFRDKVIDNWNETYWGDNHWAEYPIDDAKKSLEKLGFKDVEIGYSGFWSQGDGASFTGYIYSDDAIKFLKVKGFPKLKKLVKEYPVKFKITRSGRYTHENSTSIEWYYEDEYAVEQDFGVDISSDYEEMLEDVEKQLKDWMYSKNKEIYKSLEKAYEYETSEENIMEIISANNYEFDENGKLI